MSLITMNSICFLLSAILVIVVAQSKRIDTGPQTFNERSSAIQKSQKRYVAEEFVVYLTPKQLKAIQEDKGFLNSGKFEFSQENQENAETEQPDEDGSSELQAIESESQSTQDEEVQVASPEPIDEEISEEVEEEPRFSWIYRPSKQKNVYKLPENFYKYLTYYPEVRMQPEGGTTETTENPEEEKLEDERNQSENIQQQKFRLVPIESATEMIEPSTTEAPKEETIQERLLRLLELNHIQLKSALSGQSTTPATTTTTTTTSTTTVEPPQSKLETTLAKLRYSAKYRAKNQSKGNKDQVRKNIFGKQKLPIKSEINNSTDTFRKNESRTTQQQKTLTKQTKIQKPVVSSVSTPVEVKVPRPYPITLNGFGPSSASQLSVQEAVSLTGKKSDTKKATARVAGNKPKATSPKTPTDNQSTVALDTTDATEYPTSVDIEKEIIAEIQSRQNVKPGRITIIRHIFEK